MTTLKVEAAPHAEAFGELPSVFDAAISPDGTEIAIIANSNGEYFASVMSLVDESIEDRLVGLGEGVKPIYIKWGNDSQVVIAFWQSQNFLNTPITGSYLYTFNSQTREGKILVKPPKGLFRQRNAEVVDWLEDDPNHILMTYDNETNNLRPAIRKVDIVSGKGKMVQSGLPNINTWYTDNTGTPRIGQGQENNSEAKAIMRIWDMTNDKWRHASDYPGLDADATIFGFTHKQDELVIGDYAGKDTLGLYVYDLNAKFITRKIYHNEKYDVQDVVRSKDGNEIIGVRFTTNSSEVELLGPYDRLLSKVRDKFPKFTVEYVDQTFSGDKVIFKVSGPYEPVAL